MTGLNKTDLPTTLEVELAASALSGQGEYGAITELAEMFEVSRPTVYGAARAAEEVLTQYFEASASGERKVIVDEAQLERMVVALRIIAPNSIRAIEDLIPVVYPGVHVSYGKIQQILHEAEKRAAAFNAECDLTGIKAGALDEMFSQGSPVLAGVDLDSGFLFSLALRESRSGDDWAKVLETAKVQGLDLSKVVKDAAKGIAQGVSRVFPDAEQRDDCFHAFYRMAKLKQYLERRGYGAISKEHEAKVRVEKIEQNEKGNLDKAKEKLELARQRCADALELHDGFEEAMREVMEAMEYIELDTGHIRSAAEMEAAIQSAAEKMLTLNHKHCVREGKYIRNRAAGLALYMAEMKTEMDALSKRYGETAIRLAGLAFRLSHELHIQNRPWARRRDEHHLLGTLAMLQDIADSNTHEVLTSVKDVIRRRHRASSAIEGFNAALRPFLYVHKGVTDGFLELFRAYHNLKTRRWGRHKGTSAHECLTGERVNDWLAVLGYPPSDAVHS
jgi:transposase